MQINQLTKTFKNVVLDADVAIHFMNSGRPALLSHIIPYPIIILSIVSEELNRHPRFSDEYKILLNSNPSIIELSFPENDENIRNAYEELIDKWYADPGESACLSYARFTPSTVVASSNRTDIKKYCTKYSIEYFTTIELLNIALAKGLLTKAKCDSFIRKVTSKGSKLKYNTMDEYLASSDKSNFIL